MGGLLCCTVVKIVYHPYCHKRQSAMKMGGAKVRGPGAKARGPRGRERRWGSWGGQPVPSPLARGSGKHCKLPSGVRGEARLDVISRVEL